MTTKTQDFVAMFNLLPDSEQNLAFELVKRLVLAWDSDYTKLTPAERARLEASERDLANGETTDYSEINWR